MNGFANIVKSWKALTVFPKYSFLDVWQRSEYAPGMVAQNETIFVRNLSVEINC